MFKRLISSVLIGGLLLLMPAMMIGCDEPETTIETRSERTIVVEEQHEVVE